MLSDLRLHSVPNWHLSSRMTDCSGGYPWSTFINVSIQTWNHWTRFMVHCQTNKACWHPLLLSVAHSPILTKQHGNYSIAVTAPKQYSSWRKGAANNWRWSNQLLLLTKRLTVSYPNKVHACLLTHCDVKMNHTMAHRPVNTPWLDVA